MGFWFQRSVELGGRLGVDLSGSSPYPAGPPPHCYAIPGTSIFYRDDIYVPGRPPLPEVSLPYLQLRPEIVATSSSERPFALGLSALAAGDVEEAVTWLGRAAEDQRSPHPAIQLSLALAAMAQDRSNDAVELLKEVVASDVVLPDELMRSHLVRGALEVHATRNVVVHTQLDRSGAALLLGELLQRSGRASEVADLYEALAWRTQERTMGLMLADLYIERQLRSEVARVTTRFTANTDDLAIQILLIRARARREGGNFAYALATLEEALRVPQRDPHLLQAVRYERALTLDAQGHDELALREFQVIFEVDRGFRDVTTRLAAGSRARAQGSS